MPLIESEHELVLAWQRMQLIRESEYRIAEGSRSGEFKTPIHLGVGQEAIAVMVAQSIVKGDLVFGNHRSHAHYLALGGNPRKLFAEILGKESGCSGGRGGSMHIKAPEVGFMGSMPIVAGTIPISAGAALHLRNAGGKSIAVAFFGDGATEEGVFHETLNMASVFRLPILFVCENNLFSSHLHIDERQPSRVASRFALANEIPALQIRGSNYLEERSLLRDLIARVRIGQPGFVEALTYRWMGHVGHDEDIEIGKNRKLDLAEWKAKDPISALGAYLEKSGLLSNKEQDMFVDKIRVFLSREYQEATSSAWPTDLFRYELN